MATKVDKTDKEDKPSTTERLADDAAADQLTYEPGTPRFLAYLEMPRMRRAQAYSALSAIQAQNQKTRLSDGDDPAEEEALTQAAAATQVYDAGERYKVIALIEEYLAVCAEDEAVFRLWALSIDDAVLIKTFSVYQKLSQPGEASSSAG
jgi:hypothetical protein